MRLHPLLAGEIRIARSFFVPPHGALGPYRAMFAQVLRRDPVWSPVPVFLIEHPTQGPVLVDTGYDASAAAGVAKTMGPAAAIFFDHRPYDLDVLLERAGFQASDVRTVVMTHLHNDHVGGAARFPDATFVADRREWLLGDRGGLSLASGGYHPPVIRAIRRRQIVDFDGPGVTPLGPFARTIDLFGDGTIILLSTPGHSPGHQSLLVRLGDGTEVLLAGDAADLLSVIDRPERTTIMTSQMQYIESLTAIRRYVALHPQTVVIPGHDAQAWAALQPVYGDGAAAATR